MIQYKVVKRKKPITKEVIYHPAIAGVSVVSNQKIIERDGDAVRFGDLGSFRPTIHTKSKDAEKDVNAGDILKVRVVFTPTLRVKQALDVKKGYVRFSKVEVVPVAKKKKAAHTESAHAEGAHTEGAHAEGAHTEG